MLLVEDLPRSFYHDLKGMNRDGHLIPIRRLVWELIRNPVTGIPLSHLDAKGEWLPMLKKNLHRWLDVVEDHSPFKRVDNWAYRVTSTKLPKSGPLIKANFDQTEWSGLRFGTVHSVKGEGIHAVMYITAKKQLQALLAGTGSEDGRIGFVAATRARDLLVIAVPKATTNDIITSMQKFGLTEWPNQGAQVTRIGEGSVRDASQVTVHPSSGFSRIAGFEAEKSQ